MASPTLDDGSTTLTFQPSEFVVKRIPDRSRQRRMVSTDGTVRIIEVSDTDDRFVEVDITALPTADTGSFSGRNSLRTFILTDLNWAQNTATLTDADGDALTVRFWDGQFDIREAVGQDRKDTWTGKLLFRVET